MPILKSTDAYVCHRCWRRLFSPQLRRKRRASGIASLHTATRTNPEPRSDEFHSYKRFRPASAVNQIHDDERVRPQGWRALLQNKTLGEAASILVLRDTEEKKSSRRQHVDEGEKSKPEDTQSLENMLESLKDQIIDPAQSEVNSTIDSMRPELAAEPEEKPSTISQRKYEEVVNQMSEGFNQRQLARYITHTLTTSPHQEAHSTIDPALWQPSKDAQLVRKSKQKSRGAKGKRSLAESIVRSVWLLEIKEEVEGNGSVDIALDKDKLALALQEDNTSALKDLGKAKYVKIEVVETKSLLRIIGPKYEVLDATGDVELILREPFDAELDVRRLKHFPLLKQVLTRDAEQIQPLATSCGCTVRWKFGKDRTQDRTILLIRGRDENSIGAFKRALLSLVQFRNKDYLLSSRTQDDGLLTMMSVEPGLHAFSSQFQNVGRFTNPFKIAGGEHGSPKQLPAPERLPVDLIETVKTHLDADATFGIVLPDQKSPIKITRHRDPPDIKSLPKWQRTSESQLCAQFGYILHPLDVGTFVRRMNCKEIVSVSPKKEAGQLPVLRLAMKRPYPFLPTTNGLLSTLERAYEAGMPGMWKRRLRLKFIASPWRYSEPGVRALPSIEVLLSPHTRDRQLEVTEVTATLGTRGAYVMLPYQGTDIAFERRDAIALSNIGDVTAIQECLQGMREAYTTTGHFIVPPSLTMKVPTFTFIGSALKRSEPQLLAIAQSKREDVDIEYVTTSMDDERKLSFPYEGHELVYTHTRNIDTGRTSEGISLRHLAPPSPQQSPISPSAQQKARDNHAEHPIFDFTSFLDAVQMLLRRLSIGTGKKKSMDYPVKHSFQGKRQSDRNSFKDYGDFGPPPGEEEGGIRMLRR